MLLEYPTGIDPDQVCPSRPRLLGGISSEDMLRLPPEIAQLYDQMPKEDHILNECPSMYGKDSSARNRVLFTIRSVPLGTIYTIARRHGLRPAEDLGPISDRWGTYASLKVEQGEYGDWAPHKISIVFWKRESAACAKFARGKAWVLVANIEEAKNSETFWNTIERPLLERQGVSITWLDTEEKQIDPVYPDDVARASARSQGSTSSRWVKKVVQGIGNRLLKRPKNKEATI
ncbi:hypothetical protein MMC10_010127 [Thelotrema lepadinum]|nr:hypothetical protein [Thelotrema lepadinum]